MAKWKRIELENGRGAVYFNVDYARKIEVVPLSFSNKKVRIYIDGLSVAEFDDYKTGEKFAKDFIDNDFQEAKK